VRSKLVLFRLEDVHQAAVPKLHVVGLISPVHVSSLASATHSPPLGLTTRAVLFIFLTAPQNGAPLFLSRLSQAGILRDWVYHWIGAVGGSVIKSPRPRPYLVNGSCVCLFQAGSPPGLKPANSETCTTSLRSKTFGGPVYRE